MAYNKPMENAALPSRKPTRRLVLAALLMLICATAFAVVCATGFTELSDDPQLCANCHTMSEGVATWSRSNHSDVGCNDCHTPSATLVKFWTKAGSGLRHGASFLLDGDRTPTITKESTSIVEKNCRSCHQSAHASGAPETSTARENCADCHRSVAHPK